MNVRFNAGASVLCPLSQTMLRNTCLWRSLNLDGTRARKRRCTMRTTHLLGSIALVSTLAMTPVIAGGKSVSTSAAKAHPTVTAPIASPGFQPQQDPLGPAPNVASGPSPTMISRPTAASPFQPHLDPLPPSVNAKTPSPSVARPGTTVVNPGTTVVNPGTTVERPTSSGE